MKLPNRAVHGYHHDNRRHAIPWNKGKAGRQKPPLKLKEIWPSDSTATGTSSRELAPFNLAIDSKLRGA
jgi:hypothetical protein